MTTSDSSELEWEEPEDLVGGSTYLLCVGLKTACKNFTGEKLVDMIMRMDKKAKYLPENIQCFNQWICLREINCETPSNNKRVRCAIQLSPFPHTFQTDPDWYRADWGWNDSYADRWIAFEITKVRLFTCAVRVDQWRAGSIPFQLSLSAAHMDVSSQVLLALKHGTDATAGMGGKVKQLRTT